MRDVAFAVLSSFLVLGCGGGDKHPTDGSVGIDMHASASDLSVAQLHCAEYTSCGNDCSTAATLVGYQQCIADCTAQVSATAEQLYKNARNCGQNYCIGTDADMRYKCGLSADGTKLTEADNMTALTPGGACNTCLHNALAALYGQMCADSNSPDCSTSQNSAVTSMCGSLTNACTNDK